MASQVAPMMSLEASIFDGPKQVPWIAKFQTVAMGDVVPSSFTASLRERVRQSLWVGGERRSNRRKEKKGRNVKASNISFSFFFSYHSHSEYAQIRVDAVLRDERTDLRPPVPRDIEKFG